MARHDCFWRLAFSFLATLSCGAWCAQATFGQYTWVQDIDNAGSWDDTTRWLDGGSNTTYPNAVGATVLINQPIKTGTGLYTLTMPATDTTVGQITLDNTNFTTYPTRTTFANGGGKLIFEDPSGTAKYIETLNTGTGPANFQNQIIPDIQLNSDLEITQNNYQNLNTGTRFFGVIDGGPTRKIIKKGLGGIQIDYTPLTLPAGRGFEGEVLIQEGPIRVISSTAMLSKISGIVVSAGGQLQLADNNAVAVPEYTLASGASVKLNGTGTNAVGASGTDGALRIGITSGRTATFHSMVELQSDSRISIGAANTTGVLDNVVSGTGDLIKSGGGQLNLTANNTYTGDTQIVNGVLSITNAYLENNADVYLTTNGKFDLNFGATDTIRSLYFDGVPQPVGTYGATGSGATNINDTFFSGSGVLDVTTLPVVGVPGDYDNSGTVDAGDYVLWRKGGPLANEVDNPGVVNAQDYTEWRARFGNPNPGSFSAHGGTAVPEPATFVLFLSLSLFFVGRQFGRTRS
jgi:autotransporter-associated beta strand protein